MEYLEQTELKTLSLTDSLTGIYNRSMFDLSLEHWISTSNQAENSVFSLIFFDLDHFKTQNDILGHQVGDAILQRTAQIISRSLRSCDVFSRFGGDEFVVLLSRSDISSAFFVAERMRISVENAFCDSYGITASFGVAQYQKGDSAASLLERADANMYAAKKAGANRVVAI